MQSNISNSQKSFIPRDFDTKYNFFDYSILVKHDFKKMSNYFPLLTLCILPTNKPKEIFIKGKLIPEEILKKCGSENDVNRKSIEIVAIYPSNFHEDNIYVKDLNDKINWDEIPKKHQHFHQHEEGEILCTHHPKGEINGIEKDKRSSAILLSAWKLYIQYKKFQKMNKWTLKDLSHNNDNAIKQLKKMGKYYEK